ncbi:MAG: 3-deoxy-D-manno-octulosonate 8-phosphate phosphatase, YrbI family [Massilibacillus sp.]|jgi:3-deoxy-D-manno-octulosonate 8-phosphate phosphatase (KDO 8-P phosphatase)|nr:3-deoxy-D-manno-octulosonate 8-phosphate phosphatase, YrbI family [Massilibacillus sp.]
MEFVARASKIKLIIFDVDGVLTSGKLFFSANGESFKNFDVHDGMGISLLHNAGIKTAIITGRKSDIVNIRSQELKITDVYQGSNNKLDALEELQKKYKLSLDEMAYVGDDLLDLPILLKVGFACTVHNAVTEVKERAHYISKAEGGNGGVREIAEFILKAQGKWEDILLSYINLKPIKGIRQ